MNVLGVELRWPCRSDLALLPLCVVIGLAVGLALLYVTHGKPIGVIAEGMAAFTAGFLAAAGANLDAGWRGAVICQLGSLGVYGVVLLWSVRDGVVVKLRHWRLWRQK